MSERSPHAMQGALHRGHAEKVVSAVSPESRAIVLTQVVELGGAERACLALSRWLFEQNIPNHFVTYLDTAGLAKAAFHPVTVLQLRPLMQPVSKVLAFRAYFKRHANAPPPLMSGYQPALHATLAGVRGFHCLMHDTPSLFSTSDETRSLRGRLLRSISDHVTAIGLRSGGRTIVTSEYLREECHRVFGVSAAIARMGGLGTIKNFRLRPPSAALCLFSVSRVESNKRIDWMLRALATLEQPPGSLSSQVNWRLDIAGRGSQLETLRALAAKLGLADRVHFHGFVSDAQLEELYAGADLFLMPAVQGYGIPAIESLQRGIPVLLHRDSGVSDILLHTPWATVFAGDEDTMLPALQSAIQSVTAGRHLQTALPPIPSEDSWAEEIARLCRWI